ncbi:uncharacterized protein MKK02DRAFT_29348 [Dioszegia hungarica]|uniref:Uncharacterized protein n=1 Tax=Dioszegia hungarica TaxID=4972 RepID=A0AA38HF31_9TREE|nr:uncharacterized protein MKK02DRAFT_29348 [Dioszegia hungarica]KAI9639246.1 hypothetical protein MKK02DRAFT_29348 [Dioszegia hungarica]
MSKRSSALAALDDDEAYAPESVARSAPRPAKAPRKSAVKASTSTSKTTTTFAPSPVSPLLAYTPEDLADLPFYEVIEHFIELQSAYRRLESEKTSATASGSGSGATRSSMDEKEVEAMAKVFAKVMQSGITSQMKWQPSCRHKGKRFTCNGVVPNAQVFYKLFNLQEEKKVWKQKKIPLADFEKITGGLWASIRHGSLSVTSPEVTLKRDPETNGFTVPGLYGL